MKRGKLAGRDPTTEPVQRRNGRMGILKKQMKENVLYLMIVNLPTAAKMKEVKEILDRKQNGAEL